MFLLNTQTRVVAIFALVTCIALLFQSGKRLEPPDFDTYKNEPNHRIAALLISTIRPVDQIKNQDYSVVTSLNAMECKSGGTLGTRLDTIDKTLLFMSAKRIDGNAPLNGEYSLDRELLAQKFVDDKENLANTICGVATVLANSGERVFRSLSWKELMANFQTERFGESYAVLGKNWSDKPNPWRDLPGCTYMKGIDGSFAYFDGRLNRKLCANPLDQNFGVAISPQSRPSNFDSIDFVLQSESAAIAQKIDSLGLDVNANLFSILGREVPQHTHAVSTLDYMTQRASQGISSCYTGDQAACDEFHIDATEWKDFYEGSATRMIGMLVLDIPSGGIEALGSGHTRCYAQEHDGPGRDPDCVPLPSEPRKRDWMLVNHAAFASAMPGSLVKPIEALAMMSDPPYKKFLLGRGATEFVEDLKFSRSARFHDRLFCKEKGFTNCDRPGNFVHAAEQVGWNSNCLPFGKCDLLNLAIGEEISESKHFLSVNIGRAGLEPVKPPEAGWRAIGSNFDSFWALECSKSGRHGWEKCKGGSGSAVDLLAEAWGQGNSRVTPIGVSIMLAHLATAANGSFKVAMPHLLEASLSQKVVSLPIPQRKSTVPSDGAMLILSGMAQSHTKGGTANSACLAVYFDQEICSKLNWIAGKTGTPVFAHDGKSIAQRMADCTRVKEQLREQSEVGKSSTKLAAEWANCSMTPIKWYAALVRSNGAATGPWDKAIVVVAERNWNQRSGMVDSAHDEGTNIAARAAFDLIRRLYPVRQNQAQK